MFIYVYLFIVGLVGGMIAIIEQIPTWDHKYKQKQSDKKLPQS
jgi:hypothetical protein